MTNITAHFLMDELHFPINSVSIDGNIVTINDVGTVVIKGNEIVKQSLDWKAIYENNKKKIWEMIYKMYEVPESELVITPKADRIVELRIKETQTFLQAVQYNYESNGEWSLIRASMIGK